MEIGIEAPTRYGNVRNNAYWSRVLIDTTLNVDLEDISNYKEHLKDCNSNPTVGLLARRKYITKKPMNYPIHARRNLRFIKSQPEIKSLNTSLINKINELYPRTKHLRQYIIDSDRVILDGINQSNKSTVFNKLMIFFKRFK